MQPLITVNGVPFPEPVTYAPQLEALGSWERNANGELVGDLVGYKMKLKVTWGLLEGNKFRLLLSAVDPFFVTVQYLDPRTGGMGTGQFYAGSRSGRLALRDKNGVNYWADAAFNLIER